MKELYQAFTKKEYLRRMLLSAIVYFFIALPFRQFLSLMPGMTEIRPANAIPPVLGVIWGPSAAFGIAIGNLVSDILTGSKPYICAMGFYTNFMFAYFTYKTWYTFHVTEDDVRPTLNSSKKIIKYIFIVFLASLQSTAKLSFIFEVAGFSSSADSYVLLFLNNFDFAVVLGVPLLMLLEKTGVRYHVPEPDANAKRQNVFINPSFLAVLFISAAGFLYFIYSMASGREGKPDIAAVLLVLSLALAILHIFKPITFTIRKQKNEEKKITFSLKAKLVMGFLMIAIVFIVLIGIFAYHTSGNSSDMLAHWMIVYQTVGISINVVFAIAILFLWYVERNIVTPLETLSDAAVSFANTDHNEMIQPEYVKIHSNDEIEQLSNAFNRMMVEITDYVVNLKQVTAEKERIGTELNVATTIQASMLPSIFPPFPNRDEFDIYAKMTPAKEVGGDFYDLFLVGSHRLCVVMADVSGKGVPAALFMVIAKTLIKNNAQNGNDPYEILEIVNNQLCEGNEAGMFVTVFVGILDIRDGQFLYSNAGHNQPLLKRKGGDFEWLTDKPGFVLAGMEDTPYRQYETTLSKGDMLFMYTDGVTEATNKELELFSDPRLKDCLNQYKSSEPKEIIENMKAEIDRFAEGTEQADDITMLLLKVRKIGKEEEEVEEENVVFQEITVPATLDRFDEVTRFATRVFEEEGCNVKIQTQVSLALEEMYVNIAHYAYGSKTGDVTIRMGVRDGMLVVELRDKGIPYNPLEKSDPDTELPANEREIGGLGIFMVKKSMDEVEYRYEEETNVFTMKKKM